ncbi:MAG TPA: hypothetical protein P5560_11615 [Thermotogota bacterium]|nr:hypothetical protein [Thermotogota bacterium]
MRFRFLVLLGLVCLGMVGLGVVSVDGIMGRLMETIAFTENNDWQIVFLQVDNLVQNQVSRQTYTLEADSGYVLVALGDGNRITDIDLQVYDDSGKLLGEDKDDSNAAIVEVETKQQTKVTLSVSAWSMEANDGFFALLIARTY